MRKYDTAFQLTSSWHCLIRDKCFMKTGCAALRTFLLIQFYLKGRLTHFLQNRCLRGGKIVIAPHKKEIWSKNCNICHSCLLNDTMECLADEGQPKPESNGDEGYEDAAEDLDPRIQVSYVLFGGVSAILFCFRLNWKSWILPLMSSIN